jgi:hypothetical protein
VSSEVDRLSGRLQLVTDVATLLGPPVPPRMTLTYRAFRWLRYRLRGWADS